MAVDMFLNLGEKIKGETEDKAQKEKGDIDVLSWSWSMSQSGSLHGGGSSGGRVSINDIVVTKYVDAATPKIMLACCNGTRIDKALLLVRKSGEKQQKSIEITMEPVIIKDVNTGGSGGEDRLTESIVLNFGKVKFEYFKQDKTGATASAGELSWDIAGRANA
jgi:type VI secretion system secreted protein Hcp